MSAVYLTRASGRGLFAERRRPLRASDWFLENSEAQRAAPIHNSTQGPSLPKSLIIKVEAYGLVTAGAQRYLLNLAGISFGIARAAPPPFSLSSAQRK